MLGAGKQGGETGHLLEHQPLPFALDPEPAPGHHVFGRFGANDQHAAHAVRRRRVVDGPIAIGPVDLFELAVRVMGTRWFSRQVARPPT